MNIIQLIQLSLPLFGKRKEDYLFLTQYCNKKELQKIKKILKFNDYQLTKQAYPITIIPNTSIPQLHKRRITTEYADFISSVNKHIKQKFLVEMFKDFATKAPSIIPALIAPNILGLEAIKRACALELFAKERAHILLLGDPGTGKTDIIRATSELHPIGTFGLGSGTSGVGLSVSVVGKEPHKGLLPLADEGICAVDELNLMEEKDRAALYNAMEKGFVSYSKKDINVQFDARVRVIATANPKGDCFVGKSIDILKKQIPFDPALLTRFHLVFMIRKPNLDRFEDISRHIVRGKKTTLTKLDKEFIQEYVTHAEQLDVAMPQEFEEKIAKWSRLIKEKEKEFLVEISPRTIVGVIRLAQANARMSLRTEVTGEDLKTSMDLMQLSFEVS
ncbi:MAG: replicative DNA helicase Mcm [Candidatus Woesearchaeota archaeon]|jgi:replicative DNA helicase Mcm